MFDEFIDVGYRVRLIYTKDRYTKLKKGDTGTVSNICELPKELDHALQIWVKWDRDPDCQFALVEGNSKWEVIERK
ncbi:MAG: hypothetical protein WBL44_09345 [Nitrososphaeraceae archaeon]|jgi:hypothetical protein